MPLSMSQSLEQGWWNLCISALSIEHIFSVNGMLCSHTEALQHCGRDDRNVDGVLANAQESIMIRSCHGEAISLVSSRYRTEECKLITKVLAPDI